MPAVCCLKACIWGIWSGFGRERERKFVSCSSEEACWVFLVRSSFKWDSLFREEEYLSNEDNALPPSGWLFCSAKRRSSSVLASSRRVYRRLKMPKLRWRPGMHTYIVEVASISTNIVHVHEVNWCLKFFILYLFKGNVKKKFSNDIVIIFCPLYIPSCIKEPLVICLQWL